MDIIKNQNEISSTIHGQIATRRVWIGGRELKPQKSQKVRNHSPDGFNWGYGGSGPAQLALAIMLEMTDKATAQALYQKFKWEFVAGWQGDFSIEIKEVADWLLLKINPGLSIIKSILKG
jgi:hypothetical protein